MIEPFAAMIAPVHSSRIGRELLETEPAFPEQAKVGTEPAS